MLGFFFSYEDSFWPCKWSFKASEVELWWIQYWPSPRRGQWSDPLVSSLSLLLFPIICIDFNNWLDLDLNICSCCWMMKHSPQAIFRDPFRRGNNILVSLKFSMEFIWITSFCQVLLYTSLKWLELDNDNFDGFRLCVMLTHPLESQSQRTRDTLLLRSSAILMLLLKYHGDYLISPHISDHEMKIHEMM